MHPTLKNIQLLHLYEELVTTVCCETGDPKQTNWSQKKLQIKENGKSSTFKTCYGNQLQTTKRSMMNKIIVTDLADAN